MEQLKLQKTRQQFLYRELIRISLFLDENLSAPQIYGKVAQLTKKARYAVNGEDDLTRIQQLLTFFYQEQGFHCDYKTYFQTQSLNLGQILTQKTGMPVSLGALLLLLASHLDLPLYPVNFPTQLIIRAEITLSSGRKENHFINPWNGEFLSFEQLEKWLEGEVGVGTILSREYLQIAEEEILLERLETVLKMSLTQEKRFEDILRLIEYRLAQQPDDPYEIRDRGMILASIECYHAAIEDLTYFIDQCPNDPSALILKMEMPALKKQEKEFVLH